MTINANYTTPVFVNGYQCWNCAQVAEAKQDINPADPQAGPWGVNAPREAPNLGGTQNSPGSPSPAVTLGGALAGAAISGGPTPTAGAPGGLLDIQA